MNTRSLACVAAVCALFAVACGESTPDPAYPTGAGGYGAAHGGGYGEGASGAAVPETTGGGTTPAPGDLATPIPPIAAGLAAPLLKGTAERETRGMTADGTAIAAQFQPGQIHEQEITLQPGKCYAVVGVGLGITELDVELVIHQAPAPEYVAAQDQTTGPQAVLGATPNCFRNPLPVAAPAKVRLRATGGQGIALAQAYSK